MLYSFPWLVKSWRNTFHISRCDPYLLKFEWRRNSKLWFKNISDKEGPRIYTMSFITYHVDNYSIKTTLQLSGIQENSWRWCCNCNRCSSFFWSRVWTETVWSIVFKWKKRSTTNKVIVQWYNIKFFMNNTTIRSWE